MPAEKYGNYCLVLDKDNQTSLYFREDVESDLEFLGLLILENKLKPETKPVLQELSAANIRTAMITGKPEVLHIYSQLTIL